MRHLACVKVSSSLRAFVLLLAGALIACDGEVAADAALRDGGVVRDAGALADGGALRDGGARDAGGPHDAAVDAAAAVDGGRPSVCPTGSAGLTLDLTGVTLAAVAGVPIDDGFVSGFSILEGPVFAEGALYLSHFGGGTTPASRIYRVDASGAVVVAAPSAGTNGLALSPDGRLHGGRHADGSISVFRLDDLTLAPTPVVATYLDVRFNSPNDLAFHSNGTLFFTDPGWQAPSPAPQASERAYRVAGSVIEALPDPPTRPNGVALSLDERTLFVTGTDGLVRYDLTGDGAIAAGPFDVGAITGGLDGLGLDCAGNLYVTGDDRVRVLSPALTVLGELAAPGATNVAFGGADRRTLYVTTLGSNARLLSARVNVPGFPY